MLTVLQLMMPLMLGMLLVSQDASTHLTQVRDKRRP